MKTNEIVIPKKPSLTSAILGSLILVFVDAILFNQGVIAALAGLGLIVIGLPLALRKNNLPVRAQKLCNLGIYAIAVASIFMLNSLNNKIAADRAEVIIMAVKNYKQKYHHYPESLNKLVPEFMDHIPVAKYTLIMNDFYYYNYASERQALLFYVDIPPFGRPTYNFKDNQWIYAD